MVRYDIERQLFSGEATARDIPALWQKYMHEYLGIDVPNDTLGCLQDTHWSGGSFGYFPSYALGSAYGAQMVPSMEGGRRRPARLRRGQPHAGVRLAAREDLALGAGKDGVELLQEACGAPFDAAFYCDYLERKFSELYNVK